jgi:hypothetical protein
MTRKFSTTSTATTLSAGINTTATTIVLAAGTGAALMGGVTLAVGNVDSFGVALDVDTQNEEIVWVTQVSGDTLTVSRGQAGTGTPGVSGIAHTAGATVKHVFTGDDATFFTTGTTTADGAIPKSTVTSKGDLLVGTASGVVARQGVGTDGFVLTADSTLTNGIKWSATSAGYSAPTLGSTVIPSGTTVTTVAGLTLTTSTLTSPTINDPKLNLSINANTATTYTFVLTDNGKFVTSNNASAQTLSIPTNASVAFPIGTQINVIQIGAGQVTVNAVTSGTTTVLSNAATAAAPKTRNQYAALTAIKVATDTWYVIGDIA